MSDQEENVEIETTSDSPAALVPYERGIPLHEVTKGALLGFLPGNVAGMAILAAVFEFGVRPLSFLGEIIYISEIVLPLLIGYGLGLIGMHRWLYPDAEVSGRRSFIAGLLAPIAMIIGIHFGLLGLADPSIVSLLAGIFLALAMFFAWLTPTPEEMRHNKHETDPPSRLPEGAETDVS